jgi:hypothetical protein
LESLEDVTNIYSNFDLSTELEAGIKEEHFENLGN